MLIRISLSYKLIYPSCKSVTTTLISDLFLGQSLSKLHTMSAHVCVHSASLKKVGAVSLFLFIFLQIYIFNTLLLSSHLTHEREQNLWEI